MLTAIRISSNKLPMQITPIRLTFIFLCDMKTIFVSLAHQYVRMFASTYLMSFETMGVTNDNVNQVLLERGYNVVYIH